MEHPQPPRISAEMKNDECFLFQGLTSRGLNDELYPSFKSDHYKGNLQPLPIAWLLHW